MVAYAVQARRLQRILDQVTATRNKDSEKQAMDEALALLQDKEQVIRMRTPSERMCSRGKQMQSGGMSKRPTSKRGGRGGGRGLNHSRWRRSVGWFVFCGGRPPGGVWFWGGVYGEGGGGVLWLRVECLFPWSQLQRSALVVSALKQRWI